MSANYSDHAILLKSLQERDLKALDYVYTHTRNRLYVLAFSILQDEPAARDLVQDFFIDFWQNEVYLQIQDSIYHYITRSIRNRSIKYTQKLATQQKLAAGLSTTDNLDIAWHLENNELRAVLDAAIQHLPPMAAKVFQLHYIEQLSYAEISQQLGISKSTISSHMDRALKALRTELKRIV